MYTPGPHLACALILISGMVVIVVELAKCRMPVVLSEEVYWWLCKRKVELRVKSLDEVLRIECYRFQHEKQQYTSLISDTYEEGKVHANITEDESKF